MKILIAGAGGFAKECLAIVQAKGFECGGFLLPEDRIVGFSTYCGFPILGENPNYGLPVVIGVGTSQLRRKLAIRSEEEFVSISHPTVEFGETSQWGRGSIFCINSVITEDCSIGRACLIDKGVIISHDCTVGDYAVLSPGVKLGGAAEIGEGATLGMGAIVLPKVKIGAWATIGAGAVVTKDVPPNATAVGVPARVIKTKPEGWHLA